jgi:hypothetical protein
MKVTRLDRAGLIAVQRALLVVMQAEAAKMGVEVKSAGGKFGDQVKASLRFDILIAGKEGRQLAEKQAREDFDMFAAQFGLKPEHFGREFKYAGESFRVVGIKWRASKMPVLALNLENNKSYKFLASTVKDALK